MQTFGDKLIWRHVFEARVYIPKLILLPGQSSLNLHPNLFQSRRAVPIDLILNRLLEKQKGQEDPVDVSNLLEGMKRRRNRTNYQEGSHK